MSLAQEQSLLHGVLGSAPMAELGLQVTEHHPARGVSLGKSASLAHGHRCASDLAAAAKAPRSLRQHVGALVDFERCRPM
jgi:hypothetical protein